MSIGLGGLGGAALAGGFQLLQEAVDFDLRTHLAGMDLQQTYRWSLLLTRPINLKKVGSALRSIGGNVADVLVTQVYLAAIDVPGRTYEWSLGLDEKYVSAVAFPETVTMEFIEDEKGTVRRYLSEWESNIAFVKPPAGFGIAQAFGQGSYGRSLIFKDDQQAAKRNAILILKGTRKGFSLYPRITYHGLAIKTIETYKIGHAEKDNLRYQVTLSVDDITIPVLI